MRHFLYITVVHKSLVLIMCHFFWSPLTLQDTSYSPEPHISADRSQSLLSAQEAVSLWALGTRKVGISSKSPRDAILIHCFLSINVVFVHTNAQTNIFFFYIFAFLKLFFCEKTIFCIKCLLTKYLYISP